ncbi:hypothetical protein VaNZ11_006289 [Volvox africanus]|uniref:50S ribosomal protein L22, chloroplastic n=1 Tax=Volvox africanus TaxID=51714 RepID=A0ABQ5S1M9_9CHLO|nr:hypothetical protein VaNZ11_006289 [Volvox africanus]
MVTGHRQFMLATCRAFSPQTAQLTGEASIAWCTFWQQDGTRQTCSQTSESVSSSESGPCTMSRGDCASGASIQYPVQRRSLFRIEYLHGIPWGSASTISQPPTTVTAGIMSMPHMRQLNVLPAALSGIRALHIGLAGAAPADAKSESPDSAGARSGSSGGNGGGSDTSALTSTTTISSAPVQNPLQAALAAASGSQPLEQLGRAARVTKGRRRQKRTWMWYDEDDEREERRNERAREQYHNVGTAYMSNITQSVKKMNRIVRLVRGLSYADAVAQCELVPHKAAKYVRQALEAAYQDATQAVGLDGERLVVGIIYATRGRVEKAMQRMGRGRSGRMFTRTSHLRVVLRESRQRSPAFQMRQVAPLMSVITGANPPVAAWLARGQPSVGTRATSARRRFAYQVEV